MYKRGKINGFYKVALVFEVWTEIRLAQSYNSLVYSGKG
jgi:hypothetical protein